MERFQLAAQIAGAVRTETLMGVSYQVFPAVLVQQQVLHNNLGFTFLPADEIAASVAQWNGIPVVMRHPLIHGQPVSARSPDVLNSVGLGTIYNARFEDDALKADVYLDPVRLEAVEGAADLVRQVTNGEAGELSTAFGTQVEEATGTHKGREYTKILHTIQADHLALLDQAPGACSVTDGCGLGINHTGDCVQTSADDEHTADPSWFARQIENLKTLFVRQLRGRYQSDNDSDEDRRRLLLDGLRDTFQTAGIEFLWIESVFSDDNEVVFEMEGTTNGLFRVEYTLDAASSVTFGEPVEVRRVTTYEPLTNEVETTLMDRTQMIAALVAAATCALDETALGQLQDCQLQALIGADAGAGSTANNADGDGGPTDSDARIATLEERLAAIETATAAGIADREADRQALVAELVANEGCPFGQEELETKPHAELTKLHAMLHGTRWVGGPKQAANVGAAHFAPTLSPYATPDQGGNGGGD